MHDSRNNTSGPSEKQPQVASPRGPFKKVFFSLLLKSLQALDQQEAAKIAVASDDLKQESTPLTRRAKKSSLKESMAVFLPPFMQDSQMDTSGRREAGEPAKSAFNYKIFAMILALLYLRYALPQLYHHFADSKETAQQTSSSAAGGSAAGGDNPSATRLSPGAIKDPGLPAPSQFLLRHAQEGAEALIKDVEKEAHVEKDPGAKGKEEPRGEK